jgi:hypothetical protein
MDRERGVYIYVFFFVFYWFLIFCIVNSLSWFADMYGPLGDIFT